MNSIVWLRKRSHRRRQYRAPVLTPYSALSRNRPQLAQERLKLSQAAGEARKQAWRYFGGFWVWLIAMLATGALLGALAAFWVGGEIAAQEFGEYPGIFCSSAGGQVVEQDNGASFCAIWIKRPDQ